MTEAELKKCVLGLLTAAELLPTVAMAECLFLDAGDHMFTQLVLTDGAPLEDVQRALATEQSRLAQNGIVLDFIVLALWTIRKIKQSGQCRGPNQELLAAECFQVELVSGPRSHWVEVAITHLACADIAEATGHTKPDAVGARSIASEIVRSFVAEQLSLRGEQYWDPVRYNRRELDSAHARHFIEKLAISRTSS